MGVVAPQDFLGRDLALPYRVDARTGDFQGTEGAENVKHAIRMFLSTIQGERPIMKAYGIPNILFEDAGTGTEDVLRNAIIRGLQQYEPRIKVVSVDAKLQRAQSGLLGFRVHIGYILRATNTSDNLTHVIPRIDDVRE